MEASPGQHDDMVMATGFALMGLDQVAEIEEEIKKSYRLDTIREILEWEMSTGRNWKSAKETEFAKSSKEVVFGIVENLL